MRLCSGTKPLTDESKTTKRSRITICLLLRTHRPGPALFRITYGDTITTSLFDRAIDFGWFFGLTWQTVSKEQIGDERNASLWNFVGDLERGTKAYIAVREPKRDQDMTDTQIPNEPPAITVNESKSVLIVDDSPVMRNMLEKFFSENGFSVVGMAADGVEAIELFEKLHPDIVTLDIIMPKMRGTEVLERIIGRYPDAKIVMASSVSDARTVMKCLKIGAKQYILKPYDEEKVMSAIRKALDM